MELDYETWSMVFIGSVLTLTFLSGVITGAYFISKRDEKIFGHFFDNVLTDDQRSDIMKKDLSEI